MNQKKIYIRYLMEMFAGFVLFGLALVLRDELESSLHHGLLRNLVMLSPILPFLFVVWVVARQYRRLDEYGRLIFLQSIAIAFGATMVWAGTSGFLADAGLPRFGMLSVWNVGMSSWAVTAILRNSGR